VSRRRAVTSRSRRRAWKATTTAMIRATVGSSQYRPPGREDHGAGGGHPGSRGRVGGSVKQDGSHVQVVALLVVATPTGTASNSHRVVVAPSTLGTQRLAPDGATITGRLLANVTCAYGRRCPLGEPASRQVGHVPECVGKPVSCPGLGRDQGFSQPTFSPARRGGCGQDGV